MNMILSSVVGIVGGACLATFSVMLFGCFVDPFIFPLEQPRNESTINSVVSYSALCGAVIGLILVLGSGQRL